MHEHDSEAACLKVPECGTGVATFYGTGQAVKNTHYIANIVRHIHAVCGFLIHLRVNRIGYSMGNVAAPVQIQEVVIPGCKPFGYSTQ